MNSDSQTLKWDIQVLKGYPEDNLCFIKQVAMDLSNESVEDSKNGNRITYSLSWIASLAKFIWIPDQEPCAFNNGYYRYDMWQIEKLLRNADTLVRLYPRLKTKHEIYDTTWRIL